MIEEKHKWYFNDYGGGLISAFAVPAGITRMGVLLEYSGATASIEIDDVHKVTKECLTRFCVKNPADIYL